MHSSASAAEQGYRTDVDATAVVDALLGSLFMHLITTGQPPTRAFGQEVVAVLHRRHQDRPGGVDRAIGSAILGCEYPECIVSMHRSQPR